MVNQANADLLNVLYTPIGYAFRHRHKSYEVFCRLLKAGEQSKDHLTSLLFYTVSGDDNRFFNAVINSGADVNAASNIGHSVLIAAVK